ncbi:TonB-dependent receptor [Fulvivirgaceae bacterium BMA10]|uniref:TonB-dependent receptor n=1 Tax=Splendidivirga corallicola TaxID=3051826 RepID=A0ABT8KSM8_9BACT|nr:TonB-dependent receptor [Fulvivirgaceae bacterium BMA10]
MNKSSSICLAVGKIINNGTFLAILVLFFATTGTAWSQEIKVINKGSSEPVENVTVYTEGGQNVVTDQAGKANIGSLGEPSIIYFQHPAYQQRAVSLSDIIKNGYTVILEEKIFKIDEVVISASKWAQNKSEVPNKILSIDPETAAFENPQTSADMLAKTGQVFVQKSQLGGGSPMIRGFAANSVLIVVDGVRMNNAIFRSGNLQNVISIDPNALSSTEVIFGPGSVIYGSDALGGVMSFQTKKANFSSDEKILIKGNAFTRYASANNEITGHIDLNLAGKKLSSLTSFSVSDFDDLRTGSQRTSKFRNFGKRPFYVSRINDEDVVMNNPDQDLQIPSGYRQYNFLQKIRFRISDALDLTYTFNYGNTSNIPRYDRLIILENGFPTSAEWYYGPQRWLFNTLHIDFFEKTKLYDQARIILSYQDVEESRNNRDFQDDHLRIREEEVKVYGLNIDLEKIINDKHRLFYGVESILNDVSSAAYSRNIVDGSITPLSTRYPSGGSDYNSFAGYLSHKWKFDSRFILNSGLRYSFIDLSANVSDTDELEFDFDELNIDNGALNGSLGLVFKPKEKDLQLNLVLSSGFRSPNIDDIGKVFSGAGATVIVPNPGLKPEFTYNMEFGLTKTFRDKIKLDLVVFNTFLVDAIVQRDFQFNGQDSILFDGSVRKVRALVNTGRARIYGGSIGLDIELNDQFLWSNRLNITEGKDEVDDVPLRHTTPVFGQSTLYYQTTRFKGSFSFNFSGKRSFEDLAPSEQDKPHLYTPDGALAWFTLNLRGSYTLFKNLHLNMGLENILDTHYRPYSSGISAPGRNFYVALRANI